MNKKEQLQDYDLMELIEDSVQHHCQENMMSGEVAWVMVRIFLSQNYKNFQSKCDTLISVIRSVVLQVTETL